MQKDVKSYQNFDITFIDKSLSGVLDFVNRKPSSSVITVSKRQIIRLIILTLVWAFEILEARKHVDLYLNFENSNRKTQVCQIGILACKNQFRNEFLQDTQAVKIQFEID